MACGGGAVAAGGGEVMKPGDDDWVERGVKVWFVLCAVFAVGMLIGALVLIVVFAPHLLGLIDRIGK